MRNFLYLLRQRSNLCIITAGAVFFLNTGFTAFALLSWPLIILLFCFAEFYRQAERHT